MVTNDDDYNMGDPTARGVGDVNGAIDTDGQNRQGDSDIIFADLDHDGDGKINFEDFRSAERSLSF